MYTKGIEGSYFSLSERIMPYQPINTPSLNHAYKRCMQCRITYGYRYNETFNVFLFSANAQCGFLWFPLAALTDTDTDQGDAEKEESEKVISQN